MFKKPKKQTIINFLKYKNIYSDSLHYLTKQELIYLVCDFHLQWELIEYNIKMKRYELLKSRLSPEEQLQLMYIESLFNA